ncbi:N,N-dimethylformamidase beta subunit family domain-containing protein [Bacteroidota bacterium]
MKQYVVPLISLVLFYSCSQKTDRISKNLIIEENLLPGSIEWLIEVDEDNCTAPEHEFCRRPQIEGYCSHTSIKNGDTLNIFISTNPVSEFTIDIYRMGYYQGKGGNLKESIGPLQGIKQKEPQPDSATNFFECDWDLTHQLIIPEDWLSGVYIGKLTTKPDYYQAYIIFIVKDDRKADFIFQCSDLTWQTYNRFPYWHSMYDEGHIPWINTNGARISFDRPYSLYVNGLPSDFNPLSNGSGEFLIWEFPLAFWMEQHSYDVTYISNIDTHSNPDELLRTKGFLSVGHDEYWTYDMFENVTKARDKGVNLLFLCGNSVDGTVYLDPSTDNIPFRTTGRLPERSFDNEQNLMGSSSYGVGYSSWKCQEPDHWVYEDTGVAKGDSIPYLIGWEYHGYPLGKDSTITVLASNEIYNVWIKRKKQPHAATIYTGPKGNFVFNAGTCWWSMLLSTPPGFQNPASSATGIVIDYTQNDVRVQKMTENLFARVTGATNKE